MKLTLKLTEQEVNLLLNIIAEQPYAKVASLISKIQMQGSQQMQNKILPEDALPELPPESIDNFKKKAYKKE